jgi:hypothetical protein
MSHIKVLGQLLVVEGLGLPLVDVAEPHLFWAADFGVPDRDMPADSPELCVAQLRDPAFL